MSGKNVVERVDYWRQSEPAEGVGEGPGQLDLGEEQEASAFVTGYGGAVAEDEPPTLGPSFVGDGCEQIGGLLVGEWEQCQLLVAVECGDDPRRPAAELSAARIEQNWAW